MMEGPYGVLNKACTNRRCRSGVVVEGPKTEGKDCESRMSVTVYCVYLIIRAEGALGFRGG